MKGGFKSIEYKQWGFTDQILNPTQFPSRLTAMPFVKEVIITAMEMNEKLFPLGIQWDLNMGRYERFFCRIHACPS